MILLDSSVWVKLVFKLQTINVIALQSKIFFMSSSTKFCMRQSLALKLLIIFWQNYECLFPENWRKDLFFLVPFQISSLYVLSEKAFFGTLKFKYLHNHSAKSIKVSPFWNLLIKGSQRRYKSNKFQKVSILTYVPI